MSAGPMDLLNPNLLFGTAWFWTLPEVHRVEKGNRGAHQSIQTVHRKGAREWRNAKRTGSSRNPLMWHLSQPHRVVKLISQRWLWNEPVSSLSPR